MAFITITTSNVNNITEGAPATITGKNGFTSIAGSIPLLVLDTATETDVTANSSNVALMVEHLADVIDDNFNKHVLSVNDGFFSGLKGFDYISIPLNEKIDSGIPEGFVGYAPITTQYSANIVNVDLATNTIKFENTVTDGVDIKSKLPSPPFYVRISQIVDSRYSANNKVYLEGSFITNDRVYNVSGASGAYSLDLGAPIIDKGFICLYADGIIISPSSFAHTAGSNTVTITLTGNEEQIRAVSKHYTVPSIEPGDNVFFGVNNTYSIAETSYNPESSMYNAALTANSIYKVELATGLRMNVTSVPIINTSKDIVGLIGNLNTASNTFTVDYDSSVYPSSFTLANNKIYRVQVPLTYNPISINDRIIKGVDDGINIIRARTINSMGRRSPFVTKTINVRNSILPKVENIVITEELLKDTSQGVTIDIEIGFNHLSGLDVRAYEVSYKLSGEATDTINYQTVIVPALGVDSDGKIRYRINDIERGRETAINRINTKITPITSTNKYGIPAYKSQDIIGKTAPPENIINLAGGQQGTDVVFIWDYPVNKDGTPTDIDLLEIEIREYIGEVSEDNFDDYWVIASILSKVPVPANSVKIPLQKFGTYTYLFRTKDTSKNLSTTTKGLSFTTTAPINLSVYKTWSEENPSGNVVASFPNDNLTESNYPSFTTANNGGLSSSITNSVDNANGTSSGWSAVIDLTDLFASGTAYYQTQVRDIGQIVTGRFQVTINGSLGTKVTFNDFREDKFSGVSNAQLTQGNVLVDFTSNGIGSYLNNVAAIYDGNLKTLYSHGISGNVYAIFNEGQFANDASNANTYALIAGVVNANAIALGDTFYANGNATGGNTLPNLVSNAISYTLVNMQQFSDPEATIQFAGQDGTLDINTFIRFSSTDPFYANSNVNSAVFVTSSTDSEGWRQGNPTDITCRYFQFKTEFNNKNPNLAEYQLDNYNYILDLENKTYSNYLTISSNTTAIDYSSRGFANTAGNPIITANPVGSSSLSVVVTDFSFEGANIQVFNTNTGSVVTGVNVFFVAEGI